METPSILSVIDEIRTQKKFSSYNVGEDATVLHNHRLEFDEFRREIYIRAEIQLDCLDRGSDLTPVSHYHVLRYGVVPGDVPVQMIDKRLGGPGHDFNVLPLNSAVDLSAWKDNEALVYEHVKQGDNRHALMRFALEYDDELEIGFVRPVKMYYHFILYENEATGEVMKGVVENPSP